MDKCLDTFETTESYQREMYVTLNPHWNLYLTSDKQANK